MFQWDKSIKTLDVPVGKVMHLFRSMRDVQLALPGLPAQEASAYLCQYQAAQGVGTATIFQLHKSGQLAFYIDTPREVPTAKADAMLDQAMVFVESMGFLMTDLDIHLMSEEDREMLWASLPIKQGVQATEPTLQRKPAVVEQIAPRAQSSASVALEPSIHAVPDPKSVPLEEQVLKAAPPEQKSRENLPAGVDKNEQANVDDLLAAVEELRTRRPGLRARKKPPSPEELKRRRQELLENLGHILASL